MPHSHSLPPHHCPTSPTSKWDGGDRLGQKQYHWYVEIKTEIKTLICWNRTETERKTTVMMTNKMYKTSEAQHDCPPPDDWCPASFWAVTPASFCPSWYFEHDTTECGTSHWSLGVSSPGFVHPHEVRWESQRALTELLLSHVYIKTPVCYHHYSDSTSKAALYQLLGWKSALPGEIRTGWCRALAPAA